jgi:hypothetical protein
MPRTNHPIVGSVPWEPQPNGAIRIDPSWVSANIVTVDVPQLRGVPTYGGSCNGRVQWYRTCVDQLLAGFAAVEDAGLLDRILFWGGSWVPRLIRGSKQSPSNHSWGTAFDLNPPHNPLGQRPLPAGKRGSLAEVAPCFERFGFTWGGRWTNRPDGMHFEVSSIWTPPRPKPSIRINGVATAIAADILNGRVIAPARALTEALDGAIWYDPQRKALHIAHPRTGVHEVAIAEMRGSTAWARATDVVAACGATASWAAQNKVLNVNR